MELPSVLASITLGFPAFPVDSCAAVAPPVGVVLSAVNVMRVSAVAMVPALVFLVLWTSLLLPMFHCC